jgi:DNA-binding LacI/PurR family transcriptional regulator
VEAGLVDGVILLPADDTDPLTERLARTDASIVLLGKPAVTSLVPYVDVDNAAGAGAATEHLLRQGRRHIGMVCGPTQLVAVQDRLTGHRDALQRAGLRPHLALADLSRESAVAATARLLEEETRLDAIFASSDELAAGVLQAAERAGLRVPDDLAVVGFGDVAAASWTSPALTTVRVPVAGLAKALARLLLSRLEGRPTTPVVLPTSLVVRDSG